MNCPNCRHHVESGESLSECPFCGENLHPPAPPPPLAVVKVNWWIFFAVLLAPAIISLLTAKLLAPIAVVAPILGGLIAGSVCGTMLARQIGRTQASRTLIGLVSALLLGFFSFALGFAGCAVGGFQLGPG